MSLEKGRNRVRDINKRLAELKQQEIMLLSQRDDTEKELRSACKHPKIIYVDGHYQPYDYEWDHYHAEMRVCLSCGLTESGDFNVQENQTRFGRYLWTYKVLTGKPIRRFCVTGSTGLRGTIEYEKRANSTFGDKTYEERMCHYWAYVHDRLFNMPYSARVKKAMEWGYPA
jgi:hypothetical protein